MIGNKPCESCSSTDCDVCACNKCSAFCMASNKLECAIYHQRTRMLNASGRQPILKTVTFSKSQEMVLDLTEISLPISDQQSGVNQYTGTQPAQIDVLNKHIRR